MAIIIKSPSQYIQGAGELVGIGQHAKKLGKTFLVLCTDTTRARIAPVLTSSLEAAEKRVVFCSFSGKSTKDEIARVQEEAASSACDVVVGAGGGKAIDTAKAVADNLNLPVIIVPTVASNDAPCTGLSVIYNDEGVVIKVQFTKRNPDLVLVDTAIIAKAPVRLLAAGMGDALASWFEARAVFASGARTLCRGQCSETALALSKLCYDILVRDGVQAVADVKKGEATKAVESVLEACIYLSGMSSESGGLAAAHAVNDSLVYIPPIKEAYHGERVGFGILTQLVLENSEQELRAMQDFMRAVGLPISLAEMGAANPSEAEVRKAAEAACVPAQFTRNLPFPVTVDDVHDAILTADRLGREYKQAT